MISQTAEPRSSTFCTAPGFVLFENGNLQFCCCIGFCGQVAIQEYIEIHYDDLANEAAVHLAILKTKSKSIGTIEWE